MNVRGCYRKQRINSSDEWIETTTYLANDTSGTATCNYTQPCKISSSGEMNTPCKLSCINHKVNKCYKYSIPFTPPPMPSTSETSYSKIIRNSDSYIREIYVKDTCVGVPISSEKILLKQCTPPLNTGGYQINRSNRGYPTQNCPEPAITR